MTKLTEYVSAIALILFALAAPSALIGTATPASAETRLSTAPIVVTVIPSSQFYLGNEREKTMALDALAARMKAIAKARGSTSQPVFVRGEGDVLFRTVSRAMAHIRKAGFQKLSLVATDETNAPKAPRTDTVHRVNASPGDKASHVTVTCEKRTGDIRVDAYKRKPTPYAQKGGRSSKILANFRWPEEHGHGPTLLSDRLYDVDGPISYTFHLPSDGRKALMLIHLPILFDIMTEDGKHLLSMTIATNAAGTASIKEILTACVEVKIKQRRDAIRQIRQRLQDLR